MLYLTCTTISRVDLAQYGVSLAKDWVSVKCGTSSLNMALFIPMANSAITWCKIMPCIVASLIDIQLKQKDWGESSSTDEFDFWPVYSRERRSASLPSCKVCPELSRSVRAASLNFRYGVRSKLLHQKVHVHA